MPRKPSKPKTTRRGKNEGSVYRRKDGKWVGQVTVGYHTDTGKPIRKYTYANTREEAAHWIALTLVSETSKAVPSLASELLLKDFLHRWLTTFKTYEICSRTMELYYSCERLHIVPALGDIPVAALTASRIQTFLYYLQAEKQLSRRTTSLVRSILIQLYDYAVEMSLAPINPARSTKLPRQPQRPEAEEKVIPIAQREAVLAAAQKDPIMSCAPSLLRCRCGYRLAAADGRHLHAEAQRRSRQSAATANRPDVVGGHNCESQVFVRLSGHKSRTA